MAEADPGTGLSIRDATGADLPAITEIYNEVVGEPAAVWRDDRVSLDDRRAWFEAQHGQGLPVLVALDGSDTVVGFASFGPFRPWPGYFRTVEHTIHIDSRHRGRGVGSALLQAVVERARRLEKAVVVAGIDAANTGSIRFHERAGFREVGRLPGIGRKFGEPVGLVLLQLDLVGATTEASPGRVVAVDHVQLAMPAGGEDEARTFYRNLLGLPEVTKPPHLAARGGCWFEHDSAKVHLGVEADFRPARKAHPALRIAGLDALVDRLREAGVTIVDDEPLPGHDRVYVEDPFGNRIELLEPH